MIGLREHVEAAGFENIVASFAVEIVQVPAECRGITGDIDDALGTELHQVGKNVPTASARWIKNNGVEE